MLARRYKNPALPLLLTYDPGLVLDAVSNPWTAEHIEGRHEEAESYEILKAKNGFKFFDLLDPSPDASAARGHWSIHWQRSIFMAVNIAIALAFAPFTFTWAALGIAAILAILSFWVGHVVGVHRHLIHRAFETHPWVRQLMAAMATLVGMEGPSAVVRMHEELEWAQRQPNCAQSLAHQAPILRTTILLTFAKFNFDHPPTLRLDRAGMNGSVWVALDRYWWALQIPVALALFALGGWGFVVWGICVRVAAGVLVHWFVVSLIHRLGDAPRTLKSATAQGRNVPALSLLTFGESMHNNHHAYPRAACANIDPDHGVPDPGFWLIRLLGQLGLAWDILVPTQMGKKTPMT